MLLDIFLLQNKLQQNDLQNAFVPAKTNKLSSYV